MSIRGIWGPSEDPKVMELELASVLRDINLFVAEAMDRSEEVHKHRGTVHTMTAANEVRAANRALAKAVRELSFQTDLEE